MTTQKKCTVCGSEKTKIGKLHGVATLQSLDARTGLSGSELHMVFCADCGEVIEIKVTEPDKIK